MPVSTISRRMKEMIDFGSFDFDLDLKSFQDEAELALNGPSAKVTGSKGLNKFYNVEGESRRKLIEYFDNHFLKKLIWHVEYFNSGEPAGLHTDGAVYNEGCKTVVGVIIPLAYNTHKVPYTVTYDRVQTEYRKLMFKNGDMRYLDTGEIVEYRDKYEYDLLSLKHNPKGTLYYKQYADLKVHEEYEWKLGTMLIFDTQRWHSSSWFLSTPDLPDHLGEYKRSIIAFGDIKK